MENNDELIVELKKLRNLCEGNTILQNLQHDDWNFVDFLEPNVVPLSCHMVKDIRSSLQRNQDSALVREVFPQMLRQLPMQGAWQKS